MLKYLLRALGWCVDFVGGFLIAKRDWVAVFIFGRKYADFH